MFKDIFDFIKQEAAGGVILLIVAVIALILENTPIAPYYNHILAAKFTVMFDGYGLSKPFILWVNDGLMVLFFLLVGLEIKREAYEGELNSLRKATLPIFAAVGGMVVPALVYIYINYGNSIALKGWAIPSATDIAFALGILMLLRSRVPVSLKVFLTALAIMDDIGAILIIALFYTAHLSWISLGGAFICLLILILFNRLDITSFIPYALVGLAMWAFVLESGIHTTLTGVAIALAYPLKNKKDSTHSPAHDLEQTLLPWVSFLVLPLFAFANAGVPFDNMTLTTLLEPIPLGIIAGLFIGKQIGIMGACWIAIKTKLAKLPDGANWIGMYGVAIICGIGFTMSLFIGSLAFSQEGIEYVRLVRVGVLVGSFLSGVFGAMLILMFCPKRR